MMAEITRPAYANFDAPAKFLAIESIGVNTSNTKNSGEQPKKSIKNK